MNWNFETRVEATPAGVARTEAPAARALPRFCPATCAACGIGNIYGPPSCLDGACPNPMQVRTPTEAEWQAVRSGESE